MSTPASNDVTTTLQQLSDVSYDAMNAAVQQRLSEVTIWRNLTAGITALALAFALALSWLITRSLRAAARPCHRRVRQHLRRQVRQRDRSHRHRRGRPGAAGPGRDAGQAAHADRDRARRGGGEHPHPPGARQGLHQRRAGGRPSPDHLSQRDRAGDASRATSTRSARPCRTSSRRGCAARASTSLSTDPAQQRRVLDTLERLGRAGARAGRLHLPHGRQPGARATAASASARSWSGPTAPRKCGVEKEMQSMLVRRHRRRPGASASISPARAASSRR